MEFTSDFILYPEQSFTSVEAMNAYSNEFNRLTANLDAELTFADKTEAHFNHWCFLADEHICRLNDDRYKLSSNLQYLIDNEVDRFHYWRRGMQKAVHQAWEDVRVAEQALIDLSIQHGEFEPLFGDVEQSGDICDHGEMEYGEYPLFGYDPLEEEANDDNNPLKEKYMYDSFMPEYNPLLTKPETLAALEHKSKPTDPVSTTGSVNQDRGGTPLTPKQVDDLFIFWGKPELIEQHHHSRLMRDLEREDRTPSDASEEEKKVLIYNWLDGLPDHGTELGVEL